MVVEIMASCFQKPALFALVVPNEQDVRSPFCRRIMVRLKQANHRSLFSADTSEPNAEFKDFSVALIDIFRAGIVPEFNTTKSKSIASEPAACVFTATLTIGLNDLVQKYTEIRSEQRETTNAAAAIIVFIAHLSSDHR